MGVRWGRATLHCNAHIKLGFSLSPDLPSNPTGSHFQRLRHKIFYQKFFCEKSIPTCVTFFKSCPLTAQISAMTADILPFKKIDRFAARFSNRVEDATPITEQDILNAVQLMKDLISPQGRPTFRNGRIEVDRPNIFNTAPPEDKNER